MGYYCNYGYSISSCNNYNGLSPNWSWEYYEIITDYELYSRKCRSHGSLI